jgi:hypothetical protein
VITVVSAAMWKPPGSGEEVGGSSPIGLTIKRKALQRVPLWGFLIQKNLA